MIKLLIFDAGDLLWRTGGGYERAMKKFFKKYRIDDRIVISRWDKIKDKVEVGKIGYKEATELQLRGFNLSKKIVKEFLNLYFDAELISKKLHPFVKPTLTKLKRKYKLAILTNECKGKDFRINCCRKLGIDIFDELFSSYNIGYKKPQRKAFFIVLKHFKVKPSEAVFVGHSKDEIKGARKFKIKTIAIRWDKGTKSDYYVKSFKEIPKILEKIK
jgi:HAD superfamily hydrolase (TIGR01509 family)